MQKLGSNHNPIRRRKSRNPLILHVECRKVLKDVYSIFSYRYVFYIRGGIDTFDRTSLIPDNELIRIALEYGYDNYELIFLNNSGSQEDKVDAAIHDYLHWPFPR